MKVVDAIFRGIDLMSIWVGKAVAYLLIPLVLALTYEVLARYLFDAPTVFAHELGIYLYAVNGMMAGAWVLFHEEHVRMDALYGRFSPRAKAILDVITSPIFFIFVSLVLWHGGIMAYQSIISNEHTTTTWAPPWYPFKSVIPVAAFLLLLEGISKLRRDILTIGGKRGVS
jgi:TRAP-type mannitol/chloroaromatic compound transport system permease small subunit